MKKRILSILLILFLSVNLCGCFISEAIMSDDVTLKSIVYKDGKEESEYTVMIKEENEYVPYLVLTSNYCSSGNALLLRKYLLDEGLRYNDNIQYGSYYPDSEIDIFLNEEFIKVFSREMQDEIELSKIEVTEEAALKECETYTTYIDRRIFLLSYHEATDFSSNITAKEGMRLEYFEKQKRRPATKADGTRCAWWLRSPDVMSDGVVNCISADGLSFISGVGGYHDNDPDYQLGVRPAFCLPRDTQIVEVDGVYYIEADYNAVDVMDMAEDRSGILYDEILLREDTGLDEPISEEYKVEGYSFYVRPALSIVMEAHKDEPDYKYQVVTYSVVDFDLKKELFYINNQNTGVYLDMDDWVSHNEPRYDGTVTGYYYAFTAEEINILAELDMVCYYVGSGEGSLDKANWDTTEGLLEYCELYGDGYLAK